MSSVPPDPNELLRPLLAQQQQQQQQQSAAAFATPAPTYQKQPTGMHLPAPASQSCERTLPSLSQLIEYLQGAESTRVTNTSALAASKPRENYEQLQRYLQANGIMQANYSTAAPATAKNSPDLPQDGGTMCASPQNVVASCRPPQVKQEHVKPAAQPIEHQQSNHNQVQQQLRHHQAQHGNNYHLQDLTLQQRHDNILESLRLLAEINPDMAAMAVMQILSMSSSSSQSLQQGYQGSNLQPQLKKLLQPNQGLGRDQQQQTSTPSPFLLSQQRQSLPAQPGRARIATGRAKSSATPPTPSSVHNDGNLIVPSTSNGIIKPCKNNDSGVSAKNELMHPPPASQEAEAPLTNGGPTPGTTSKTLYHEVHLVKRKCAANSMKGKDKSEKKHSPKASSDRFTKELQHLKASPPVAVASEIEHKPSASSASISSLPISNPTPDMATLQSWSLEQLEMHVQQLKHSSLPIPQHLAVLLFDNRRKEEKRKAKRLANRKSATISRARKKAFIDDMTKDNARLRKRAALLEVLPDLVIAVNMVGEITFCGSQVETVLKHSATELMGVNIRDVVAPNSRRTMQRLIQDIVSKTQQHNDCTVADGVGMVPRSDEGEGNNSNCSSDARCILRQYDGELVPVLEVNVNAMQPATWAGVYLSADPRSIDEKDRVRNYNNMNKSTTTEMTPLTRQRYSCQNKLKSQYVSTSNCDENESTSSCNASDRIISNVDDVVDTSLTAHNVDGKLLSLMSYPSIVMKENLEEAQKPGLCRQKKNEMRQSGTSPKPPRSPTLPIIAESCYRGITKTDRNSESEDSRCRESPENPEKIIDSLEVGFGAYERLGVNRERIRLAPVYKICFVRGDLSTVWCELTSSLFCKRSFFDDESSFDPKSALAAINNPRGLKSADSFGDNTPTEEGAEDEVLICIRPTCEGEKVGEEFRFVRTVSTVNESEATSLSEDNTRFVPINTDGILLSRDEILNITKSRNHPRNQQTFDGKQESKDTRHLSPSKKLRVRSHQGGPTGHDVHSVAESLVLMSNNTL
ncbi:hypothetical protein ACHAW6_008171 [Cyclotella cf. meneghiniana]